MTGGRRSALVTLLSLVASTQLGVGVATVTGAIATGSGTAPTLAHPSPVAVERALVGRPVVAASAASTPASAPRAPVPALAPAAAGSPGVAAVGPAASPLATISPPYSDGFRASHCTDGLYQSCRADSVPDRATGAVRVDLAVMSPGEGIGPGLGTAQAASEIVVVSRLDRPAPVVLVTITVRLRSADVRRAVAGLALPPLPTSSGQAFVSAGALHGVCGGAGCFVQATEPLVDLTAGPQSRAGEELTLRLRLVNPAGAVPAGEVAVSAGVYGRASLGSAIDGNAVPDVGTISTRVDAVVTSITLEPAAR